MKHHSSKRLLIVGCMTLGLGIVADGLGWLTPRPPASELVRRMQVQVQARRGYQASMDLFRQRAVGQKHTSCEVWRPAGGPTWMRISDGMGGIFRSERWDGNELLYVQRGCALQARITLRGADELALTRWSLSGFPTLEELVDAISRLEDLSHDSRVDGRSAGAWVLRGRFPKSAGVPEGIDWDAGEDFYGDVVGRPWQVWISRETGLPMGVLITTGTDGDAIRLQVNELREASVAKPAWAAELTPGVRGTHRLAFTVDARNRHQRVDARRQIYRVVDPWRESLFQSPGQAARASLAPRPGAGH